MPLDPGIDALLQAMARMGRAGLSGATPEEARAAFRAVTCDIRPAEDVVPVGSVEDGEIEGPAGPLRARIYRPEGDEGAVPTILFLHGGGWVIGDIDTHDNQARRICRDVGAVVVAVDYRLAPEHPFPAGVEDCWAALHWVAEHVGELGGDAARIAVSGDSAGGNLAAAVARRARDAGAPEVAAQLLLYPGLDIGGAHDTYASRTENAEGKLLTAADMGWFTEQYIGSVIEGLDLAHPDLSPLRGDLKGLPTTVVVVGEFDPLRDEAVAFAEALDAAGTPVTLEVFPGLIHGFFDLASVSPATEAAVARTTQLFRDALA